MKLQPSEHQLQAALCEYLDIALRPELAYRAIPNGGLRHIRVAARLKAEGVRKGSPDLFVMLPAGRVGWIEMKTPKGRQSPEQKGFEAICNRLGHLYAVAHSLDEAIEFLRAIGALKPGTDLK
jgi:hypothetical protein